ncbi:MAG: alpha,2-mannosidase [Sphingobacteriales bacterium]|nr:alpha,2-mannosidase [Sphingobacteriales bacterium]
MKYNIKIGLQFLLGSIVLFTAPLYAQDNTPKLCTYVNPFIGTGAVNGSSLSGNNFPGATVPFGMVQLSPDTKDAPDWGSASGYDYNDKTIAGFSHTHLSGTGVAELFDILVMPTTGKINTVAGDPSKPNSGYSSRFSHDQESARPGYYQVKLLDYDINAELTATTHSGFHRYTYPKESQSHLVIDLNHSLNKGSWSTRVIQSQIKMINDHTVEGYRVITGWAKMRKIYFHLEFSKPIIHQVMVDGGSSFDNTTLINGSNLRAVFDFNSKDGQPLLVKIGISPVSIANAKNNLDEEIKDWGFDKTVLAAENSWEKELSKIKVEGSPEKMKIFYSSLYHSFLQPNSTSDLNGDYNGADFTTRNLSKGTFYSTFSLWDTYRAAHPLYTLVQPERTADFVNSMVQQYDSYGYLPIWQLWGQENYCMIGNHSIPVLVDAIFKGIKGIDTDKAYEAVKQSSLRSHTNSPFNIWEQYKYMPENLQTQSVSITLEMAFDDWCVAQLAKKLGKTEDYNRFIQRSQYFKNLYDSKSGFFRAKDDKGKWIEPFNPLQYGSNGGHPFTEGNAWQYFWYVPHDVKGLISLCGGDEKFTEKLDTFFNLKDLTGEVNGNASGFIGQYAHGNEPSHHAAYLYNYAGQPWKTQYYVAKVINDLYTSTSSGYAGNEDCGEMSSWFVFSAMGLYPVNPASGVYIIGSPALTKSSMKLSGGKTFTITAKNPSAKNVYIQSAKLNGKAYSKTYLTHSDISKGGLLEFVMGDKPNKKWGSNLADKPVESGF